MIHNGVLSYEESDFANSGAGRSWLNVALDLMIPAYYAPLGVTVKLTASLYPEVLIDSLMEQTS